MGIGQSAPAAYARDVIGLENMRTDMEWQAGHVSRAFAKCVLHHEDDGQVDRTLSDQERLCIREYASLYHDYVKATEVQLRTLHNQHQRDLYERMMRMQEGPAK